MHCPKLSQVCGQLRLVLKVLEKKPAKSAAAHRQLSPDVNLTPLPTDNPISISPSHSSNPSTSVAQPDQPRTLGHPDPIASGGPWRDVQGNAVREVRLKSPSDPQQQNPWVPRDQYLIVHGLPEILADSGSLETRHDIDELLKVIKHIVPPCEVIIILKTHRLGPRVANLPNSPRPLRVVFSETAMRDLLMKSRFHLRGSHPSIYFHVDRLLKERQKLTGARLELQARIAIRERGLTILDLTLMKTQRPYLWHGPLVFHVPPSIPGGDQ